MGLKTIKSFITALFVTTMLCVSCHADQRTVNLAFDYDYDVPDLAGFNVYVSNESGAAYEVLPNEITPASQYTIDMIPGAIAYEAEVTIQVPVGVAITFYFVATALDTSGLESEYSNEDSKAFFIEPPTTTVPTTTTTVDNEPPPAPYIEITLLINLDIRR